MLRHWSGTGSASALGLEKSDTREIRRQVTALLVPAQPSMSKRGHGRLAGGTTPFIRRCSTTWSIMIERREPWLPQSTTLDCNFGLLERRDRRSFDSLSSRAAKCIDPSIKVAKRCAQIGQDLSLGAHIFGACLVANFGRCRLAQRCRRQDFIGSGKMFHLLPEGAHALELAFRGLKAVLVRGHCFRNKRDLAPYGVQQNLQGLLPLFWRRQHKRSTKPVPLFLRRPVQSPLAQATAHVCT